MLYISKATYLIYGSVIQVTPEVAVSDRHWEHCVFDGDDLEMYCWGGVLCRLFELALGISRT